MKAKTKPVADGWIEVVGYSATGALVGVVYVEKGNAVAALHEADKRRAKRNPSPLKPSPPSIS